MQSSFSKLINASESFLKSISVAVKKEATNKQTNKNVSALPKKRRGLPVGSKNKPKNNDIDNGAQPYQPQRTPSTASDLGGEYADKFEINTAHGVNKLEINSDSDDGSSNFIEEENAFQKLS